MLQVKYTSIFLYIYNFDNISSFFVVLCYLLWKKEVEIIIMMVYSTFLLELNIFMQLEFFLKYWRVVYMAISVFCDNIVLRDDV